MASIVTRNGKYYPRVYISGKQVKFSPGLTNKRLAQRTAGRVEELVASRQMGELSLDLKSWLKEIQETPLYDKLAELGLVEERQKPHTLEELVGMYVQDDSKKERTLRNRRVVGNMLMGFFGDGRMVDSFQKKDADALYKHMRETLAVGTYQRRVTTVKAIFSLAVALGWLQESPFSHLKGGRKANRSKDFFITSEMAGEILAACPDSRWRLIFTLARWGGLRIPSELTYLKWSDIFWQQGKFRISTPKLTDKQSEADGTLTERFCPLFPEIQTALLEYWETLPEGTPDRIFPEQSGNDSVGTILRKQLKRIVRRAGLTMWPKPFTNLRATRDTELQGMYPLHLVCEWMGHSPEISLKHYAQTTQNDYLHAAGTCTESIYATPKAGTPYISRYESDEKKGLKWGLAPHCRKMRQNEGIVGSP